MSAEPPSANTAPEQDERAQTTSTTPATTSSPTEGGETRDATFIAATNTAPGSARATDPAHTEATPEKEMVVEERPKESAETPVPAASPTPAASSAGNDDKDDSTALVATTKNGYYTSKYFIGSMAAIGLSAVSGIGGFALAASILTVINTDIGPSANLNWVSIVYLITQTIGQLILGRLTDLFGRRHFFFGCSVLALIGSIVCATAKNVDVLIGGNTIMGLASAAQMSFPYLVTEIVPINWRFYSMGYIYTIAIPFTAIGPVISQSIVVTPSGWRGIYYMFIAINIAAAIAFWLFYYPPNFDIKHSRDKLTKMQIIKDFDYVGLVLFSGGLLIFLLGLQWGGGLHPWNSSWVIATIVIGGVAVIAFCLWEAYAPIKEPLVPPHLLKSWAWFATVMNLSLGVSLYYSFYLIWPAQVFALYADNRSVMYVAWLSCAASAPYLFGTISVQYTFRMIGHAKIQVVLFTLLAVVFVAGCACVTPNNMGTVVGLLVIGNYCAGWFVGLTETLVSIAIPDQTEIGVAVGLAATFRSGISTVATAVFLAVYSNRLTSEITSNVVPALVGAGLPAKTVPDYLAAMTAGDVTTIPGVTNQIMLAGAAAYKVASANSYSTVYLVTLLFSVPALFFSFWVPNIDERMTNEVSAVIYKAGEVKKVSEVEEQAMKEKV